MDAWSSSISACRVSTAAVFSLRVCSLVDSSVSHQPLCSASALASSIRRTIRSLISFLTFAKGSSASWPTSEARLELFRRMLELLSRLIAAWRALSSPAGRPFPSLCLATCTRLGAAPDSAASALASTASMAFSLRATPSARRRVTANWLKRTVAPDILSVTAPSRMPITAVMACSSSARMPERWSQVTAFSWQSFDSSFRYSWSSSSTAATVVSSLLFVAIASCFSAFSFWVSCNCFSLRASLWCSSCMNLSCSDAAVTSALSTSVFLSVNAFCKPSSVSMIVPDLNV
mmetsp:Transcript_96226/g.254123  ORF Transcript_96226/g.254123 Transcript_96226/m.254123 type:complete len:289 (+) Transcript_96226:663-1529(+)